MPFLLSTDLDSLICNTQCGNFRICLPLRIYVKLTLIILKAPKTVILTIWPALNFEFLGIFGTFKCKIPKKSKFKASKIIKIADFNLPKSAKIDFT